VLADDAADDEQAKAGAALLGGEVGVEDFAHVLRGDSAAGILEGDGDVVFIAVCADMENAAGFHGLAGVFDDVVEGLLDLVAVEWKGREVFAELRLHENVAVLELRGEEGEGFADEGVEVLDGGIEGGGADGAEELGDDVIEAGNLLAGDAEGGLEVVADIFGKDCRSHGRHRQREG